MRRAFLSTAFRKYENDLVELILEGIQERGGKILNVTANELSNGLMERLIILYEDSDNNEIIKLFLRDYLSIK